ncbi:hypothetical protein GCM10025782_03650 [Pedococcus ginsenosidimutans]|uniref:DUF559 domain-containing protein n=1 Tax=Pedococcus ginsenosidimutans TaxID=490570 RepID=A0ABP8XQC4_9MICO
MGETPRERRARLVGAAEEFGGVLSRHRLAELGADRNVVAREVRAERWRLHGARTVALHTGRLSDLAQWWRAVWEVGQGAVLDGVTALHASGMKGFDEARVHVSVDHLCTPGPIEGVRIHRVRDALEADSVGPGPPRVRPAVATVRAAQWAVTDRQAALLLCLPVQQGLVRAKDLCHVRWPGAHYGRTALVRQLVADLEDGAHSLGELDFARFCRLRGLPTPSRQVVRRGPQGRIYLDVRWDEAGLVVEIDGAQHRQGLAVTSDNLRRNHLLTAGDLVLTIDLVGLRLQPEAFMDQVLTAYRQLTLRRAG